MRKAVLSMPVKTMIIIVLVLLTAVVSSAMVNKSGEKGGDIIAYMKSTVGACGFGCDTCITEPVDFAGFMGKMSELANDCDADKNKCGTTVCMTANFGNPGDYYKVNEYNLHDNNLERFTNYLIDVGVISWGANIFCERTNADGLGYEIDPYYKGGTFDRSGLSTSLPHIETAEGTIVCRSQGPIHGEFAVAHGSDVKITTKYLESLIGHTVDLKVVVNSGTYTNDLTPSPQSECTPSNPPNPANDVPCNSGGKPKWGHCVPINEENLNMGGICKNPGYCMAYPANCKPFEVTCTQTNTENTCSPNALTTECTKPPAAIVENGYKTTIGYLTQGGSLADKQLALYVIKDSQSGNTFIGNGKEKWYGKQLTCIFGPCEVSSTDPNAKVSVAVTKISIDPQDPNKYEVKGLQGCF